MKKLYALLVLGIMAISASAQVNHQLPVFTPQVPAITLEDMPSVHARQWTGALPSNALKTHRASSRRALSSVQELVGGYKTTQVTYDNDNDKDTGSETAYTFVQKGESDNEIIFTSLLYGYDLKATVDLENGEFEIPHQQVFTHSTYGSISLTLFFYYEGDDENEADWYYSTEMGVPGLVNEDGTLLIGAYYCLTVDSYTYQGKTYTNAPITDLFKPGLLTPTNGAMVNVVPNTSSTDEDAEPIYEYYAAEIAVDDDVVSVTNFGGFGETVKINLASDNTLTIKKQLIYQGGDTYGNFYTYSYKSGVSNPTKLSQIISETPISGEYNAEILSWGPWIMYSKVSYTKEYGTLYAGGAAFYTDGTKFPDPSAGISAIKTEKTDGAIYSIDGRRLNEVPSQGLYIRNGKKYFVK